MSIDKIPHVLKKITLSGTQMLPPVPFEHNGVWKLAALIVAPEGEQIRPVGRVEWELPSGNVVINKPLSGSPIDARPANLRVSRSFVERARRQDRLQEALERLIVHDAFSVEQLSTLVPHYAALLPSAAFPYYWFIAPGSQAWLHNEDEVLTTPVKLIESMPSAPLLVPNLVHMLPEYVNWIDEAIRLADSCDLPQVAAKLRSAIERLRGPLFTLAVVGEFKRGKTMFVNQLLGAEVLYTNTFISSPLVVSVMGAVNESASITYSDGRVEQVQLSPDLWERITQAKQGQVRVNLALVNEWLTDTGIEIIDTPSSSNPQIEHLYEVLGRCDCVALVISATSPFGMTEADFLKQELVGRRIPSIVVVLTNLDRVEAIHREKVFDTVRKRVNTILPNVEMLSTYPLHSDISMADVHQSLRQYFARMVGESERYKICIRQLQQQLLKQLNNIIAASEHSISVTVKHDELDVNWMQQDDVLKREFDLRREALDRDFSLKVADMKLFAIIEKEWLRALDSSAWIKQQFPFSLHHVIAAMGGTLAQTEVESAAENANWLNECFWGSETKDRSDLASKLGQSPDMLSGYLLSGPAAIATGIGINTFNTARLSDKTSTATALQAAIERAKDEFCIQVKQRRERIYEQLFDETLAEALAWHEGQRTQLTDRDKPVIERVIALKNQVEGGSS